MIAGLRGVGIPAGYVSGFLRTIPPKGKPRLEGADAMHAWVRVWCGQHAGWLEFDPTNAMLAGPDHITIGHGRDYADISPIVGVLRTTGGHKTQAVGRRHPGRIGPPKNFGIRGTRPEICPLLGLKRGHARRV